jgi:putative transposase
MNSHAQKSDLAIGHSPTMQPLFDLTRHSVVVIKDREFVVERRLPGNRWQFLDARNGEPRFHTDAELAVLMGRGEFFMSGEQGVRIYAPPPPSPLAIGPESHERNLRKHAYVSAALENDHAFRRSRGFLVPIITKCAAERGEAPPSFTSVLAWIDEYRRFGDVYGTAAYCDRHDRKGARGSRLEDYQERAIEAGLNRFAELGRASLAYPTVCAEVRKIDDERGRLMDRGLLPPASLDHRGRLKPPSLRTFERRCAAMDRFERDWVLKGPAYAKQKNRTYQTVAKPERPYQEVEVDHTTLDILLIDDSGLLLGRPDLIVFRDRATAMILGYGLGYDQPSYASFLEGLCHAYYPKDAEGQSSNRQAWPCFGRVENLIVDNALHFLGDNIKSAARELGFHILPCRRREPWLKGGLERFFGSMNTGLVHQLPGTTRQNVLARKDHEYLGEACLTLAEFRGLFEFWVRDIYHMEIQNGLGPIPGVGARPLTVWRDKVKSYSSPMLPSRDIFISLAGDIDERTIQKDGIAWDYIKYESPELWGVLADPRHKRRSDGSASRYKVVRDPFDLSEISLIDHDGGVRRIPASLAYRDYATGLSLHQHQVVVNNAREARKGDVDLDALMEAKAYLAEVAAKLRAHPGRRKVQRALARYLSTERSRREMSTIRAASPGIAANDFLDLRQPNRPAKRPRQVEAKPTDDFHTDDIEDLEAIRQRKGWRSYNG